MSSACSATIFLSRAFSSSSWRRRMALETSMPPYFARHLYTASQRRACATLDVNRSSVRRPPPQNRDADLRRRLRELAEERRRFGVQRLHVLLRSERLVVNHKRTERLYREEGLSLRLRPTKKCPVSCRPSTLTNNGEWILSALVLRPCF